ncbi:MULTISPECIES: response regulator transcription factor [Clostridium]|uniref:Stage 0 sporulation protein A homolog n=3 Tax=Clostridium TaxID=1485 RepID=D8GSR5_CLOLD|nr:MULTISPECIES: response regulator transcription factor [Clostridium]ADK14485.1 two-component response regulator [Clostridium ljungdahlii DSM 13528]AGY77701.1 response regulator transcription factor [Clostridium autoethanogenum DSM 10061]ALU37840.1 Two component response regulator [Clostridium autoethanogenum DSM 10061]OAA88096.1 Response regulator protein GraR [Clostridium ljungdahlii DSM 13528]OVY49809.1 Response regulator protein GraR [Clostridium autoethanogenum]
MYKILIVEDDMAIAKSMKNYLSGWNYETEFITDFKDITAEFIKFEPHLVLLDISLPFFNGYHWCSEIRRISRVPIIFISSMSDNMNIIMAVNMGGDDFIPKPFDLNILVAKVQALLRRTYSFGGKMDIIEHNGVVLNLSSAAIEYENKKIELTKNEFKILQILLENVEKVVPRDVIMTRLWESDSYIDDNTLTVNITRLRKKLSDAGICDFIKTKKGIGYMVE